MNPQKFAHGMPVLTIGATQRRDGLWPLHLPVQSPIVAERLENSHSSKMRRLPKPFAAILLLLSAIQVLCPAASRAEDPNKIAPSGYVIDLAGVLDPNAKSTLEALCTELQQKTGAQLAIVTVHSLEGRPVEDYAVDVYKHLGVGPKKDDRGVLLLVSPDEKKYRIEVGYGLEPVINDARAGDVGRAMVPFLRSGNFDGAIQTAAWQLAKFVADDSGITLSLPAPALAAPQSDSEDRSRNFGALVVLIIIVIYLIIAGISRGGRGGGGRGFWWFLLGMFLGGSGGGGSSGGGFGGSSGGGDFGGFGGGSSGGGGASGSW